MKDRRASVIISEEVFQLDVEDLVHLLIPAIERWITGTLLFSRMEQLWIQRADRFEETPASRITRTFARLAIDCCPVIQTACRFFRSTQRSARWKDRTELVLVVKWETLVKTSSQYPCAAMLRDGLEAWVRQQNLYAEWFLDALIGLLGAWRIDPHTAEEPQFFMTGSLSRSPNRRLGTVRRDLNSKSNAWRPAQEASQYRCTTQPPRPERNMRPR